MSVTGAGRGFGKEFARAALGRGDNVAATARNTSALDDLVQRFGEAVLPLQLDVTDRDAAFAAVKAAHEKFGHLDVVVNNAGYGLFGMVDEITEQQLRNQLEVNLSACSTSRRPSCRSCARRVPDTSSRSPRSVASEPSPTSAATTHRSGPWRA
jgi:NAD(P)-dependent dehydrogenase (short-subunit alcohol dehydrogenase family)